MADEERLGSLDYTAKIKLELPYFDVNTWHDAMWNNFKIIDSMIGTFLNTKGYKGIWLNAQQYFAGDTVSDPVTGNMYVVLEDHVTPADGTLQDFINSVGSAFYTFNDPVIRGMEWASGTTFQTKPDGQISYSAMVWASGIASNFRTEDWESVDADGFFNKRSARYYAKYSYNAIQQTANNATTAANASASAANHAASASTSANNAQIAYQNAQQIATEIININIEEYENTATSYKLVYTQRDQTQVVTPNLIGPKGSKGDQGIAGTPGQNGISMLPLGLFASEALLRSAITSPAPGDCYSVGTSPSFDQYVWSAVNNDWINQGQIMGPQGIKGDKGDKGDTGDTGPAGPQGNPGTPGPQGESGSAGADGIDGAPGINGIDGLPGKDAGIDYNDIAVTGSTVNIQDDSSGVYSIAGAASISIDDASLTITQKYTIELMISFANAQNAPIFTTNLAGGVKWWGEPPADIAGAGLAIVSFRRVGNTLYGVWGGIA